MTLRNGLERQWHHPTAMSIENNCEHKNKMMNNGKEKQRSFGENISLRLRLLFADLSILEVEFCVI